MLIRWGAAGLVMLFLAAAYYLFSGDPNSAQLARLEVREDPREDDVVIFSWSGGIDAPMAGDIWQEFNKRKDKASRFVIELDSLRRLGRRRQQSHRYHQQDQENPFGLDICRS